MSVLASFVAIACLATSAEPPLQELPSGELLIDDPTPRPGELELRSHEVDVVINNGFAATTIEQVLDNPTSSALEATWSFPLPEEGSLSELSLWIDGQRVVGEVVEKSEADRIYESEKSAGESTAKAEQNGFTDYRITVSPVPAGGDVQVRVVYYQPLEVDQGVGRYLYPLDPGGTDEGGYDSSFWSMEKRSSDAFRIDVTLKTSFPVDGLHSPSHPAFMAQPDEAGTWTGDWVGQAAALDRDFVLFYRLAPEVPARVEVLTHRAPGEPEGTFMAVVTPGDDLEPVREGVDWMFVLDVSGSMKGLKLRQLVRGATGAIDMLRPQDRFQVLSFNNGVDALTRGWVSGQSEQARQVQAVVEQLQATGGTNIFDALDEGYRRLDADRSTAIVLVSDGVANTGPSEYRDFIQMAKLHDARLFTFVMGNSANERLLGDLSSLSGGFAKSVSVRDEVPAQLMLARERMGHQAMHGVKFELGGAVAAHPERLPSLYLGQQLVVFGRYDQAGPSELKVTARISGEERSYRVPVELPEVDTANPEIERLYALAAIADLERAEWLEGRSESETRAAIVDMAVAHSLVTDHTSMVVVAENRKAVYGLGNHNAQRRAKEEAAAQARASAGNQLQVATGGEPLGGNRAAHAPSRAYQRSQGGGGAGALGPWELLAVLALAAASWAARHRAQVS